jgi:hypothetical protein
MSQPVPPLPPLANPPSAPKPLWKRWWLWTAAAGTLLLIGSLVGGNEKDTHVPAGVLGADAPLSDHDREVVEGLGTYISGWNQAAAPLILDYQDPNVSAEEWVAEASQHIVSMRRAVMNFDIAVTSIEDAGLRGTLEPFVANLQDQLAAVVELHNAVARFDPAAEQAAVDHFVSASQEHERLGEELLDRLRPYIDADELRRLLQEAAERLQP